MKICTKAAWKTLLCGAVLALGSGNLPAVVLVSDNFSLSSGSNVGTVNDTESSGVGTYSTIQGTTGMSVTTVSGFGAGNVLSFANNTNTYYRGFNGGSTLTLGGLSAGETLSLQASIRFDGGFGGADNFSLGFVNQGSANSIIYANIDLNDNGSASSEFRYRTGTFNMSDAGTTVGTGFASTQLTSTQGYLMQLDITKQLSGDYVIQYYLDGVLRGNVTQLASGTWATAEAGATITGIAFRHSQTPGVVTYLDNVQVSVVPEPSTYVLLGLGLASLVVLRRRART